MTLRATCPSCGCHGDIEVFFSDDDGKRFAALFAEIDPALGRSTLAYLRLFKPPKSALRMARAERIVGELLELVAVGTVCKDERSGIRRPATPAIWTVAIEQMLQQRDRISLPLESHNYLRAVAFALAEQVEAKAEARRIEDQRAGRHRTPRNPATGDDPLSNAISYARQMHQLGAWSEEQRDAYVRDRREALGEPS